MQAVVKFGMQILLAITLLLSFTACSTANLSGNEPLPTVSPLPLPQLLDWIEQISPVGETEVRSP